MWTRIQLKTNAKESFKRFYWMAVLAVLVLGLLGGEASIDFNFSNVRDTFEQIRHGNWSDWIYWREYLYPGYLNNFIGGFMGAFVGAMIAVFSTVGILVSILVTNVFVVGGCRLFMTGRKRPVTFGAMIYGFQNGRYGNVVKTMFLRSLFTFLWSLLLVIPGIIKAYEYRMIPYLLSENPDMDYRRAFDLSKKMMTGEKWNAFVLDLSFFWWYILDAITFGILGLFYLKPYIHATNAELYTALRQKLFSLDPETKNELPGYDFD